jgi:hypothetical protein
VVGYKGSITVKPRRRRSVFRPPGFVVGLGCELQEVWIIQAALKLQFITYSLFRPDSYVVPCAIVSWRLQEQRWRCHC